MASSDRLSKLGRGVFGRNDFRKQAYRIASKDSQKSQLVDLSLGSTDLSPPSVALEAIKKALFSPESASYCLHTATRPFREAVASWSESRFGVMVDPDREVLTLVGSQEGTAHLPLCILNPGDSGLIMDPSYPSHRGGMVLADARIERLILKQRNSWRPDFQSLSKNQLDQLKMMVLGFPHNPTAEVGEQSWLEEAMSLGVRHQVVVAHDNPYVDLALEGEAPVLLRCPGWRECGIEFFSLSKAWCLGGFRLAFAIGAEPLIRALRELKGVVDFNQSLALQHGAIAALNDAQFWPQNLLTVYRKRRDRTLKALDRIGWEAPVPSMALYLWLPIPAWAKELSFDDEKLAADLLNQTGIALTPGSGFGEGGANWLRLALVRPVEELELAVERMRPWWDERS